MSPFEATSTALIKLAVESLASAPHYTPQQRQTRTEAVVCAIMAFLPSEPVQTMLASQAVGHHLLLLDTFREIDTRALTDSATARLRAVSANQTRMTLALIRELRTVRREAQARVEADSQTQTQTQAQAQADAGIEPPPAQAAASKPPERDTRAPSRAKTQTPPPRMSAPEPPPSPDDAAFEAHLNEVTLALSATLETLEEAGALDSSTAAHAARFLDLAHAAQAA